MVSATAAMYATRALKTASCSRCRARVEPGPPTAFIREAGVGVTGTAPDDHLGITPGLDLRLPVHREHHGMIRRHHGEPGTLMVAWHHGPRTLEDSGPNRGSLKTPMSVRSGS